MNEPISHIPDAPTAPEPIPLAELSDESTFFLYQSPLPSVETLAEYAAISPALAEEVIAFHREALTHEEARLDRAFRAQERNRTIAILCAFFLALLTGYGGIDALAQGDTAMGMTLSGGSLSALAVALWKAYDRHRQEKTPRP